MNFLKSYKNDCIYGARLLLDKSRAPRYNVIEYNIQLYVKARICARAALCRGRKI